MPLWKNKFFYFGDAEANRIAFANPGKTYTVPTVSERNGDFSEMFRTNINNGSTPFGIFAPNSGGQVALTQTGGVVANPDPNCAGFTTGTPPVTSYPTCTWKSGTNGLGVGTPTTNVVGADPAHGDTSNAIAKEILTAYPLPNAGGWNSTNVNTPASGNLYSNYTVNAPVKDDTFQWDQRLDWNISAKDQTYARYSYTHEQKGYQPPLGSVIDGGGFGTDGTNFNLAQNFMLSETHLVSPTLINEFRFGYNWGLFQYSQFGSSTPASTLISGLGGVPSNSYSVPNGGLPVLRFAGSDGITSGGADHDTPSTERQNIYQVIDNVTKIVGSHSLKFGGQTEAIRTSFSQATYSARLLQLRRPV